MNVEGIITILVLLFLGFVGFCIYFIFKMLQFVIQAINLYKDMVIRQNTTIKLLKDIRDGKDNSSDTSNDNNSTVPKPKVKEQYKECSKCYKKYPIDYDGQFCEACGGKLSQ